MRELRSHREFSWRLSQRRQSTMLRSARVWRRTVMFLVRAAVAARITAGRNQETRPCDVHRRQKRLGQPCRLIAISSNRCCMRSTRLRIRPVAGSERPRQSCRSRSPLMYSSRTPRQFGRRRMSLVKISASVTRYAPISRGSAAWRHRLRAPRRQRFPRGAQQARYQESAKSQENATAAT